MTVVGFVLALWSTTGAMTTYMTALNLAYERKDRRSLRPQAPRRARDGRGDRLRVPARRRAAHLRAAARAARRVARRRRRRRASAGSGGSRSGRSCSSACSPRSRRSSTSAPTSSTARWQFLTPGSLVATVIWLAVSGGFASTRASFGSYNKTWGSLAAVIVMLTWLWLAALALLLGAEVNAEVERSRELRGRRNRRSRLLARCARVDGPAACSSARNAAESAVNAAEEDERLLGGHRHAGDLLVGERARPPRARRVHVEGIDRARDQREQQAERGGEHEGGEEVRGLRAGRVAAVHDRPPDADARERGT